MCSKVSDKQLIGFIFIYEKRSFHLLGSSSTNGLKAIKRPGMHVKKLIATRIVGQHIVDEFWCISVDNSDEISKRIEALCETHNVVGAYGVADYASTSLEKIYQRLGNKKVDPSAFVNFANKHISKKLFEKAGVDCPHTLWAGATCPSIAHLSEVNFESEKVVIKPSNSNNSQGVSIKNSSDFSGIQKSIKKGFSFSETVLVEQFVCGKQINVDGLMIDGHFHLISLTERNDQVAGDVSFHFGRQLSHCSEQLRLRVNTSIKCAATALQYLDGPLTADCVVNGTSLKILEISPHLHSVKLESLKGVKHPLSVWMDTLMHAEKCKIDWGSLFRLGEQVSYLLVCANKDGVLRLDQSK